jgi:molybdate transport system substrate-binding protein
MKSSLLFLLSSLLLIGGCLQGAVREESKVNEFNDLFLDGTMIAACDPGHCPAGRYAYMVVTNVEIKNSENGRRLRENIVTNDPNVRAVLDKVLTRDVDAGFVYITDAYLEEGRLRVIEIPREYSPLPQYGISIINYTKNYDEAALFVDYITSEEGQKVLNDYGFLSAIEEPEPFLPTTHLAGKTLIIYAASSLTEAFRDAAKKFEDLTGVKVTLGFGSSGTLRGKIEGGAPSDIYATASLKHAEILMSQGIVKGYSVFARNHLVVITAG